MLVGLGYLSSMWVIVGCISAYETSGGTGSSRQIRTFATGDHLSHKPTYLNVSSMPFTKFTRSTFQNSHYTQNTNHTHFIDVIVITQTHLVTKTLWLMAYANLRAQIHLLGYRHGPRCVGTSPEVASSRPLDAPYQWRSGKSNWNLVLVLRTCDRCGGG